MESSKQIINTLRNNQKLAENVFLKRVMHGKWPKFQNQIFQKAKKINKSVFYIKYIILFFLIKKQDHPPFSCTDLNFPSTSEI
jgi:hypothetical protein